MYLVRHDQVNLSGICYGQSDIEPSIPYEQSAKEIQPFLMHKVARIYSSPLKRCAHLATHLFPDYQIQLDRALMEVDFGDWEQQAWSDISRSALDRWAQSPTHFQLPRGEHLSEFYNRVSAFWNSVQDNHEDICVITHAGVIRILMSLFLNQTWQSCLSMPVPFLSVTELGSNGYALLSPEKID